MSDARQLDLFEPGNSHRAPTALPPLVRFMVAACWVLLVFWGSELVFLFFPGHSLLPGLLFRLIACTLTAAGFVFLLRVMDYNPHPLPIALGLPCDRIARRQWITGFALGALLITADLLIIACLGSVHFQLHLTRELFLRSTIVAALLLFGALMEELAFRGYPFQKLTEAFGAFWAIILLSALFGAVHLLNPDARGWLSWGFFNTLAIGVIFALARIRTGSLWFSFGLHFGWNLFQGAVFGLPVSGLREFATVVNSTVQGSPALTGRAYGPEASATCAVVLVIALPLLWHFTAPQNIQHHPRRHPATSGI